MLKCFSLAALACGLVSFAPVVAAEDYAAWPVLKSTFPSTGGGGITIKGYDPVITAGRCVTTFMAVEAGPEPKVYANLIEFEAVPVQGGTLCRDGKWRAFEGGASGTTPFRLALCWARTSDLPPNAWGYVSLMGSPLARVEVNEKDVWTWNTRSPKDSRLHVVGCGFHFGTAEWPPK
jgi:hypothetical protein